MHSRSHGPRSLPLHHQQRSAQSSSNKLRRRSQLENRALEVCLFRLRSHSYKSWSAHRIQAQARPPEHRLSPTGLKLVTFRVRFLTIANSASNICSISMIYKAYGRRRGGSLAAFEAEILGGVERFLWSARGDCSRRLSDISNTKAIRPMSVFSIEPYCIKTTAMNKL